MFTEKIKKYRKLKDKARLTWNCLRVNRDSQEINNHIKVDNIGDFSLLCVSPGSLYYSPTS